MSVYYKFNSELNYSYVDFDGLFVSVSDLKKSILHQKRLGKSADFDLMVIYSFLKTSEIYLMICSSRYQMRKLKSNMLTNSVSSQKTPA